MREFDRQIVMLPGASMTITDLVKHYNQNELPRMACSTVAAYESYQGSSRGLAHTESLGLTYRVQHFAYSRVVGCARLLASGRALPFLPKILASHALVHSAEGKFFRNAVREACELLRIPLVGIRERELDERANAKFGKRAPSMRQHISELGKTVGSPWTQDEKTAALAGLIVSETNSTGLKLPK